MKRYVSVFLCFALLFSVVSINTFAAAGTIVSDFSELKAAIENGDTEIIVTADIQFTETIDIDHSLTITGQNNPKLTRESGFTGTLLSVNGTDTEEITLVGLDFDGQDTETNTAVYITDANAVINDCVFEEHTGRDDAAALFFENGTLSMTGCTVTKNHSVLEENRWTSWDGREIVSYYNYGCSAVYLSGDFNVTIKDSSFTENSFGYSGTAISTPYDGSFTDYDRTMLIENCDFEYNNAYGNGEAGAVLLTSINDLTVKNSKFNHNTSLSQAGAIILYYCNAVFENCEINYNKALHGCSGALHAWCCNTELYNTDICYNVATAEGAAICVYCNEYTYSEEAGYVSVPSSMTFHSGNISHNSTTDEFYGQSSYSYPSAGAVFVHDGSTFTMNGGYIEYNDCENGGGGVYVDDGSWLNGDDPSEQAGKFYMNGGYIRYNTTAGNGGGVAVNDDPMRLNWEGNPYYEHGRSGSFVMTGGTIRDNYAAGSGGGVYLEYNECETDFQMTGGVIYDNLSGDDHAGDDIFNEKPSRLNVVYTYTSRDYGDILNKNVFINPISGYTFNAADASVPFIGWFEDNEGERYVSPEQTQIVTETEGNTVGMKAIWGGYLLLYIANYGTDDYQYDTNIFLPDTQANAAANMFTYDGHRFIGWNTLENGTGDWYYPENGLDTLYMDSNKVLYAQWEAAADSCLTVTKTGAADIDENRTFLFRIIGNGVDVTVTVHGNDTITLQNIPAGEYTVTELTDWSWRYTPDAEEKTVTVIAGENASVTFENERTDDKMLDNSAYCVNIFESNEKEYTLNYVVIGDPTYGKPADAVEPSQVTGIPAGGNVALANALSTAWKTADGSPASTTATYIINYLEHGTEIALAPWPGWPARIPGTVGQTITENAIDVDGYRPLAPTQQTITLKPDVEGVWTFTGWCSDEACTTPITEVNDISADTTVYGKWVYSETYNNNEITFYYVYEPVVELVSYTVRYLDIETLEEISPTITLTAPKGSTVTVTAPEVINNGVDYMCLFSDPYSDDPCSCTLVNIQGGEEIVFLYQWI